MALGKGKIERFARIYVGGYDLSGDARTFSGLDNGFESVDMTSWSNSVHQFMEGLRNAGIRGFQAFINDATGQSFDNLKDAGNQEPVTILFGTGAVPIVANSAYLLPAIQIGASVSFDAGAGSMSGDFLIDSAEASDVENPLGWCLMPSTSLAATTNGTTFDTGSSAAAGWSANVHVLASASGDFAFKIEHSTNGSDWADLGSFTIDGDTTESEHISGTASVNRYVRFTATRTAGTITAVCAFALNSLTANT